MPRENTGVGFGNVGEIFEIVKFFSYDETVFNYSYTLYNAYKTKIFRVKKKM